MRTHSFSLSCRRRLGTQPRHSFARPSRDNPTMTASKYVLLIVTRPVTSHLGIAQQNILVQVMGPIILSDKKKYDTAFRYCRSKLASYRSEERRKVCTQGPWGGGGGGGLQHTGDKMGVAPTQGPWGGGSHQHTGVMGVTPTHRGHGGGVASTHRGHPIHRGHGGHYHTGAMGGHSNTQGPWGGGGGIAPTHRGHPIHRGHGGQRP